MKTPISSLGSPLADLMPISRIRHHLLLTSKAGAMTTTSLSTSSDDVNMSPTDLSITRKDTSSFTSPSSGFDSPSMHYSGHVTREGRQAYSTTGSMSDGVEADQSRSMTASPPLPPHQPMNLSPVREIITRIDVSIWNNSKQLNWLIYVRVSTITAIWTVGHRLRSTPTNGHRFTALSLPWWSPIQVLTGLDVT